MDKALFISMTGASQSMLAQKNHANNLANVNTTAFKADLAQARAMPVFGEHFPTRAYAMTERSATDFEQGSLMETGRELDVAVAGSGWIAVQAPDGSEAYTRAGDLSLDANGMLRTRGGLPVLGNGGPVALPPASKIELGTDGTISIVPIGAAPNEIAEIDRIKLVNPPLDQMEKDVDGLIRRRPQFDNGQPMNPDGNVRLEPGFLESSNVSAVDSLTQILSLSRQFELQVKVMQSADQNEETAARLLQNS